MSEQFCREHGMHHETELRDPDCVFEDGMGVAIDPDDAVDPAPEIPGFEGTRAALAALTIGTTSSRSGAS